MPNGANQLLITIHPNVLQWEPITPAVRAGWEPLQVAVDWEDNQGKWSAVRIGNWNIADAPGALEISRGDETVYNVYFPRRVKQETRVKFDLTYVDETDPGLSITVDPELILRP